MAEPLFFGTLLSSYLWLSFTSTLQAALQTSKADQDYPCTPDDILEALWLIACATLNGRQGCAEGASESLLDAIFATGSPRVPVVVAPVKTAIVDDIYFSAYRRHIPPDVDSDLAAPGSFIPAISRPDYFAAHLSILADLLDELTVDVVPYRVKETVAKIADVHPLDQVPEMHQLRFARSLRRFCEHPKFADPLRREVMSRVVSALIFLPYDSSGVSESLDYVLWLQNAAALEDVRLALVEFRGVLSPTPELTRVTSIIDTLEAQSGLLSSAQPVTSPILPSAQVSSDAS
ncbi:hypothetical protein C8F01DRAFT_1312164 [Mycena amicta]|nr:hypothetical protein C8F01DRAFT_1312164 [Mycena amicta]